ncbi:hypothetical protein WG66_004354 [Moniliophthora roreri]|nr:hypothetical protein WG66_004354 [Moniliophthora roreri]
MFADPQEALYHSSGPASPQNTDSVLSSPSSSTTSPFPTEMIHRRLSIAGSLGTRNPFFSRSTPELPLETNVYSTHSSLHIPNSSSAEPCYSRNPFSHPTSPPDADELAYHSYTPPMSELGFPFPGIVAHSVNITYNFSGNPHVADRSTFSNLNANGRGVFRHNAYNRSDGDLEDMIRRASTNNPGHDHWEMGNQQDSQTSDVLPSGTRRRRKLFGLRFSSVRM